MTFGIDVSNWNPVSSWQQAKNAGVKFGIAKATEGLGYTDPTFAGNWQGMKILDWEGAYHFGHPKNNPVAEADHFLSVVSANGGLGANSQVMLDMETTDGLGFSHAASWSAAWMGHVASKLKTPLFYTYEAFKNSMGGAANQLTSYPLCIAAYQSTVPNTAPWPSYALWQEADNGSISGIAGQVDIDVLGSGALSLFAPSSSPITSGGIVLAKPATGVRLTPSGAGYWIVAGDGGVFAFGDAKFFGSMAGKALNAAVVALEPTPDGGGYWLVGADGGIFCFGNAQMFGSMGGKALNAPIVGMTAAHDGLGYALVGADGGIFAFGDVPYEGAI